MKKSIVRFVLVLVGTAFLGLATSGCQTTKGFGKDVEKLGDNIQEGSK